MILMKHKKMKDVAFYPVRVIETRRPNYMKVFGYWWIKQLNDLNGCSETIEITNLSEWQSFRQDGSPVSYKTPLQIDPNDAI